MANTVLITGCSSGIGEDTARLFAARGWNVVATARNPYALGDWSRMANVLPLRLDVTDEDAIGTAVAAAASRFGTIDVLVKASPATNAAAVGTIVKVTHGARVKQVELAQSPDEASDPAEVAKTILKAATDQSGRLRYPVGGWLLLIWRRIRNAGIRPPICGIQVGS